MNASQQDNILIIFTDAATSPQMGIAIGAYLYFSSGSIVEYSECNMEELSTKLSEKVVYAKYESKKSTWSEIKTVMTALDIATKDLAPNHKITVYTDCQSLVDLLTKRKEKLEKNNYVTRGGKVHQHAALYKDFFKIAEQFKIQICKIKGHHSKLQPLTLYDKIFSVLDKLSRKKLRSTLKVID